MLWNWLKSRKNTESKNPKVGSLEIKAPLHKILY